MSERKKNQSQTGFIGLSDDNKDRIEIPQQHQNCCSSVESTERTFSKLLLFVPKAELFTLCKEVHMNGDGQMPQTARAGLIHQKAF